MLTKTDYWLQPIGLIFKDLKRHRLGVGRTRRLFVDRGSDILFVAHLDTVEPPRYDGWTGSRLLGAGFDDRLGCKIAYNLGEELGCDVLLTDLEEQGESTAQHHTLKGYNWICEFDRAGDDVVTYGMENEQWLAVLKKYWDVNPGLFSDISFMNTDCCAMNLGIGYQHAHSKNSYYDVDVVNSQILLFRHFFKKQCKNKYIADESKRESVQYNWAGSGFDLGFSSSSNLYNGTPGYEDEDQCCCICGNYADEMIYELPLCESCIDRMVNKEIMV